MAKRKKKPAPAARSGPPASERFASRPLAGPLSELKRQLAESSPKQASDNTPGPASQPPTPPPRRERSARLDEADEDALSMAMVGVRPLSDAGPRRVSRAGPLASRTQEVAEQAEQVELEARSRLDALVSGGVSFRVDWQDEYVTGLRTGADPHIVRRLRKRQGADDTLDLHGMHARQAEREVARFVRGAYRRGLELVCVVHGKGLHSEDGRGVLREVSVEALTQSGASACVVAFCTAPASMGGTGALVVQLKR